MYVIFFIQIVIMLHGVVVLLFNKAVKYAVLYLVYPQVIVLLYIKVWDVLIH